MGERAGFSAHTSINRKDFGVSFNQVLDAGGVALSEKVDIHIEVEATRAT
jgi:polyisoprenoid-binding protein YceI